MMNIFRNDKKESTLLLWYIQIYLYFFLENPHEIIIDLQCDIAAFIGAKFSTQTKNDGLNDPPHVPQNCCTKYNTYSETNKTFEPSIFNVFCKFVPNLQ